MSSEDNAATSRRVLEEAFNQGNFDVIDQCCAEQVVTHDPADPADRRGIEAQKDQIRVYRTAMPDLVCTVDDIFASDDEVVTRWHAHGTNNGELMGMPPTGREVSITGLSIDRFDGDGRIVEVWNQWDNLGFMQQLGMTANMPEQAHL